MHALSLDPELGLREIDPPTAAPGEASIRVTLAGICHTDTELVRGYMGFRGTLGHEFVGVVEECAEPNWIGKRVNGEINLGCGSCPRCADGMARHCPARSVLGILNKDGCFAEHLTLPIRNLVEVPDEVTDEQAVFVEPLAAAFEILRQVDVSESDRVAVLGDGKLGLLVALALVGTGCELHAIGRHPEKLKIAAGAGARTWTQPHTPEGEFDLVVESTGRPEGLAQAIGLTRPRGNLVLKSTFHGATPVELAPVVIDELTIVGSRCGVFNDALVPLRSRQIDPRPLIHETLPLRDGVRAMELAQSPGVLKVLLRP